MTDQPRGARARQQDIFTSGARGERPAVPVSADALAAAAHEAMSDEAWAYIAGGAGMGTTMSANRAAFDRWRIVPRMLVDTSDRDLGVTLFGRRLPAPLLLAPIGVLELFHPDADVAVARAAASTGVPMIMSSQGSRPMEECAQVMGDAPRWFQLYWSQSTELALSFVRRAEQMGAEALVLTLDTTSLGWRPQDLDLAYLPFVRGRGIAQYTSDPVFQRQVEEDLETFERDTGKVTPAAIATLLEMARVHPGSTRENVTSNAPIAAVRRFVETFSKTSLDWDDVAFLREQTELPIVLKGIQHPDDARRARDTGVDGVVVSNHGGRQVDGAVGSLDALPDVVDAIGDDLTVLFDSGIRCGADVVKALALGADAVCLGRPFVHGLAVGGARGVAEVLANFLSEIELTMALSGRSTVDELTPEMLAPTP